MTVSPKITIPVLLVIGGAVLVVAVRDSCACLPPEKAYEAAIKSDLKNLVTAQEWFYADSGRYAEHVARLGDALVVTDSVAITIVSVDSTGFTARGTHGLLPTRQCELATGTFAESRATDGVPVCRARALR